MSYEIGAYEIGNEIGDDASLLGADAALIGAVAKVDPAMGRALLAKRLANAVPVRSVSAKELKKRIYYLGFDSITTVPAGNQTTQSQTPSLVFKGTRLLIPATVGVAFLINSLTVGIHPQFLTSVGITGSAFAENVTDNDQEMNTCNPGVFMSIIATNISVGAVRFLASVRGIALED
jgi:hypothetical protein